MSGHRDRVTLLDRVHKLGAEPADLCVLQPRLSRSLQEYAAVRVLLALQTRAVRPRGARFPSAVPKARRITRCTRSAGRDSEWILGSRDTFIIIIFKGARNSMARYAVAVCTKRTQLNIFCNFENLRGPGM
ncbi:uncharacterized protein LOC122529017 [Frieseomelitta varia]|uniref:uncharacterized protein LOC122529017 n=1 Tax=Frieseomelitta varia TaxID=561572 RepID=UPI001CB6AAF3|nr:uncharacterized protein LOC122529017 [Frieseomelitta varia]